MNKLSPTEKHISHKVVSKSPYKDVQTLHITKSGIDMIKNHEKLRLRVYQLDDGKYTVGYGHAESINQTKLKIGQRISKEKAEELLKQDIKIAEDGIKRLFAEWKEDGNDVKLTHKQFDALVSMTFNMGVRGFRNTEVADLIKNKKFKEAAERIKTTKVSKKFSGLYVRREAESDMFKGAPQTADS